jgi:hypothetical protein
LLCIIATAFTYSTRIITGTITDDAGKPVIAYIQVKNSKKATVSLSDGSFKLEITDDKAILIVGAIGFETKEVSVGKNEKLTIRLKAYPQGLDEVVVMGAGKKIKAEAAAPGLSDLSRHGVSSPAALRQYSSC